MYFLSSTQKVVTIEDARELANVIRMTAAEIYGDLFNK